MSEMGTHSSTTSKKGQPKFKQLSPIHYVVRWLYRIIFLFIGTTLIATVIQTIATIPGSSLTLSSLQDFFFIKLAIKYPLQSSFLGFLSIILCAGGFIVDYMLTKTEKVEEEEEMRHVVKESIVEILELKDIEIVSNTSSSSLLQLSGLRSWWGEIPNVPGFVGRQQALNTLVDWVISKNGRLIAVLGFGGIGKTSLVAKFAEETRGEFEFIYWRSMQNAPSFKITLSSMLQLFITQQRIILPDEEEEQISLLISYLKKYRCLLVLDNWETLLGENDSAGQYRVGFETYGDLLQRIAEADHHSCLILTSREKPRGFSRLEVNNAKIHSLSVKGLEIPEARLTLKNEELAGSHKNWEELIQLYAGNPLYLKLVAELIQELFGGQISKFLETGEKIFGSLQDPVEMQFNRLSALEKDIMYWLMVERDLINIDDLCKNTGHRFQRREILTGLETLHHRSIIETVGPQRFTLQPVILEYVTAQFAEKIVAEIVSEAPTFFASHPLIKARAKDYIRNSQIQLLLNSIAEQLLTKLGKIGLEMKLKRLLVNVRADVAQQSTYVAGNILNLLIQVHSDLRGYDFSQLTIKQAYLQGVAIPEINFAFSNIEESVFTDTFGGVLSLAHNTHGTLLVAGTTTGEIRLWQLPEGRPLRTLQGHTDWVMSVALSHDGSRLVSGSEDLTVRVWDLNSGQCLHVMQGHEYWVRCVALHPDGNVIASAGEEGATKIWDMSTGECLITLPERVSPVRSVAFSPDGKLLANSSGESTIRIWDSATWQPLYTLEGHTSAVWCVTFSPDGRYLASSSQDKTVRIWDVEQRSCLHVITGHTDQIWSITYSPDGRVMVSTSEDQTARIWDARTFELLQTLQGHADRVWSTVFTRDGKSLLTASQDQSIRFWDVISGQLIATLRGYTNPIKGISAHPSRALVAAATSEQTIHIWNRDTGRLQSVLQGHTRAVRAVAFSPDGRYLASSAEDLTVRIWNTQTNDCFDVLEGHRNWVWSLAFHPKSNLLASGSFDHTVRVWSVNPTQGTKCIQVLEDFGAQIGSVAFSPDGTKISACGGYGNIAIWNVNNWQRLQMIQGHNASRVTGVAFDPTGSFLATSGVDQMACIWDAETGALVSTFQGHTRPVWSVAFSHDGTLLATSGGDRTVRLWTVETQQMIAEFQGHTNTVVSVQFTADDRMLASGSEDGTVRLWDRETKECITVLSSLRPYERMDITGIHGITPAEKSALHALGAIERPQETR